MSLLNDKAWFLNYKKSNNILKIIQNVIKSKIKG